mmetsp:Transcript_10486/g.33526  ORF Transcript_10486/g.33526 Transcript_10486/m.33526 type:complete len:206 (+) Transcript_10486:237-854(+)
MPRTARTTSARPSVPSPSAAIRRASPIEVAVPREDTLGTDRTCSWPPRRLILGGARGDRGATSLLGGAAYGAAIAASERGLEKRLPAGASLSFSRGLSRGLRRLGEVAHVYSVISLASAIERSSARSLEAPSSPSAVSASRRTVPGLVPSSRAPTTRFSSVSVTSRSETLRSRRTRRLKAATERLPRPWHAALASTLAMAFRSFF